MNINTTLWHRIKSGISIFLGLAAGAFLVAIFSDEGFKALGQVQTWVGSLTGNATLATLIGIFLRELWAQAKNKRNMEKAFEEGRVSSSETRHIEQY